MDNFDDFKPMDFDNKDTRDQLREKRLEREKRFPKGLLILGTFWIFNIISLLLVILMPSYEGTTPQVLSIISLVGVFGTGVLAPVKQLHVVAGAVGAIFNGLALGYASQCKIRESDNYEIQYLYLAALCNIISGTVAHEYFLSKEQIKHIYNAYKESDFNRATYAGIYAAVFVVLMLVHFIFNSMKQYNLIPRAEWQGTSCDSGYPISSLLHVLVFGILWFSADKNRNKNSDNFYRMINFPLLHTACIVSSFGMAFSWFFSDIVIFVMVQYWVVTAHGRVFKN